MIREDFVSIEVAKLLKGKGYNEVTAKAYNPIHEYLETCNENNEHIPNGYFSAPTLCHAKKWLREEKEIHIMVDVCVSGYYAVLWKTNGTFVKTLVDKGPNDGGVWNTYEYALEAGILEALKLI